MTFRASEIPDVAIEDIAFIYVPLTFVTGH